MKLPGRGLLLALVVVMSHPAAQCLAGQLTTLANFDGTNGANPSGAATFDSAGNLYGTALTGGANNDGTVWEISQSTGLLSTVASFNTASGIEPIGNLTTDSQGNIFGTAYRGGSTGQGTVWEINHATGLLTTLANFSGTNGATPVAGVTLDSQGNLYGTTTGGGLNGQGTVWEISHSTGLLTTLVNFNGANGSNPTAGVTIDSQGNLYGTTETGGTYAASGGGTVWKIDAATGQLTTLANFNYSNPVGGVTLDSQGNLYGTTANGAAVGGGQVWEINHSTGQLTFLAVFNGANGFAPEANVLLDGQGNIYGTASSGGANNDGTIWELDHSTGTLSALASFDGSNGEYPVGDVNFDSQGNLVGTANYGGTNNEGTVWELQLAAVPEPSAFILMGTSLVVLAAYRRSRHKT